MMNATAGSLIGIGEIILLPLDVLKIKRQTNPAEDIGGPLFVEGSAFGRSSLSLRSDYATAAKAGDPAIWVLIGRDPTLEKKLLNALFKRI